MNYVMRTKGCVVALALTAGLLVAIDGAGAQAGRWARQPKNLTEYNQLAEYTRLVTSFRRGDDAAVQELARWPESLVVGVVAMVPPDGVQRWDAGQFKAAVMLHTAVALALLDQTGHEKDALVHLETGTELLWRGDSAVRAFAAAWHTAMARLLLGRRLVSEAGAFLKYARQRMPDDSAIQYLSGVLAEHSAGRVYSFEELQDARPGRSIERTGQALERLSEWRNGQLDDAARWLRAALHGNPGDPEALVHLGRVEMLRGHDEDALGLLREGAGSPRAGPDLKYLAALFEGALHERSGHVDDAVISYRRATAVRPGAQSASIALSEALRRTGHGDESRAVLRDGLSRPAPKAADPWWTYGFEDAAATAERLRTLLAEARR